MKYADDASFVPGQFIDNLMRDGLSATKATRDPSSGLLQAAGIDDNGITQSISGGPL